MEDRKSYTYRGWNVSFDPPPIPIRSFDWSATHPDYDGEGDDRLAYGATRAAVQAEVDEWFADNIECPRDPKLRAATCGVVLLFFVIAFALIIFAIAARAGVIPEGW